MIHHSVRRFSFRTAALVCLAWLTLPGWADPPKDKTPVKASAVLPMGALSTEAWLKSPTTPLEAGEIDRLVNAELQKLGVKPAALTTDEQFLRRVTIDLTGRLPTAKEMSDFLAAKNTDKRAKVIDRLLDSDEFGQHWARYWRDVITSRLADLRGLLFARQFETWLAKQFTDNKSWAGITHDILTAKGEVRNDEPEKLPQGFFLITRTGADAATERAAETSRIFLGMQIQCAQCHDHPSDVWKRQQFHEFAAYFARLRDRPIRDGKKIVGVELVSVPFGEHSMPGMDDAKQGTTIMPRFLDGKAPAGGFGPAGKAPPPGKFAGKFGGKFAGGGLNDQRRRDSLAEAITSKNNPWFAGAFVNRIWGELVGQSFYQPVDDMGPQKEAVMPAVLARVSGSFRGSDYDVKELYRQILNSDAYQRQMRPTGPGEDHLLFASASPRRMSADALWQTLVDTLGSLTPAFGFGPKGPKSGGGGFGPFRGGLELVFKREFQFDPSAKPDEVEGSVGQALMLMNNPIINGKIQARGNTVLAKILDANSNNDDAVKAVYQRALGRRPTQRELDRCREHLRTVGNRTEAFEDLLWALVNSTEFQTRR